MALPKMDFKASVDFLSKTPSKLTRGGFGFKAKLEVNFDVNANWIHGTNGIFMDLHLVEFCGKCR